MKTRTRKIARAGIFGSTENPQVVTEKDLQEIYNSFSQMNGSPVTLGHDFSSNAPRLGDVIALELKDGELYATVKEQDALTEAVEQGFFPDVSIGAKRSAETGRLYLHHLAYLGEEPPAIKNLRSSITSSLAAIAASDIKDVILFPSANAKFVALSDSELGGSNMNEEELKKKIAELEEQNKALKAELEKAKESGGCDSGDSEKLKAENEQLKAKLSKLAEKYPEEELALSDTSPQARALMAELRKSKKEALLNIAKNKLPPSCNPALIALADSIPVTGDIALSDGSKSSEYDCLKTILEAIPEQVWSVDVIGLSDSGIEKKQEPVSATAMMGCI